MATFLIRLDDSELEALRRASQAQHRSMNEIAREGLRAVSTQAARDDRIRGLARRVMADNDGLLTRLGGARQTLLTLADALSVVDEMGPLVGDPGLLASAVGRPAAAVFGEDAYPDLATKVASLLDSVVRNHALVDGNKRLGWALAVITIWLNGTEIAFDEDDAFAMVMSVAGGNLGLADIARWFAGRIRYS